VAPRGPDQPLTNPHFLEKYFIVIFEIIDATYNKESTVEAKRAIMTAANNFFLGLLDRIRASNTPAVDLLILCLINHNFSNFRLFYPAALIQEKLRWRLSNDALSDLRLPYEGAAVTTESLLHVLFVKLAFQDKTTRNKLNSSVFEPIVALGNQVNSIQTMRFLQFEFVRSCISVILSAERQAETVLDSKTEGFTLMAVGALMHAYRAKPEVYFERDPLPDRRGLAAGPQGLRQGAGAAVLLQVFADFLPLLLRGAAGRGLPLLLQGHRPGAGPRSARRCCCT
jgi:hypothetical protein